MNKHLQQTAIFLFFSFVTATGFAQTPWTISGSNITSTPATANVGVGITPTERFHIYGGALKIGNSTSPTDREVNMIKIGDGNYVQIGEWEADDMLSFKARNYNFTNGPLGIGLTGGTTPSAKLDIAVEDANAIRIGKIGYKGNLAVPVGGLTTQFNIDFTGYRDINENQVGARIAALRFNSYVANSALIQKTGLAFYTNPTGTNGGTTDLKERMRITPEGKIGIGTTNPERLMEIVGEVVITNNNGDWTMPLWIRANSDLSKVFVVTNTKTNTDVIRMHGNGTVGVKKLYAEAIDVVPSAIGIYWFDHVFASDYKLRPLQEVEQFIKANSHLPEIPSAAEINENGYSLTDMQGKLLMKIEELTLYIIQQQEMIQTLNVKVEKLENQ